MQVEHPNARELTPEELQGLEKLKTVIEQVTADGRLSEDELQRIKAVINADHKVLFEELELVRTMIQEKMRAGELSMDW